MNVSKFRTAESELLRRDYGNPRRRKRNYILFTTANKQITNTYPMQDSGRETMKCPNPRWYALWVYRGLASPIIMHCKEHGIEYYRPVRLTERFTDGGTTYSEEAVVPNLLFVKTAADYLPEIKRVSGNRGSAYCYPGTYVPAPIDDKDMEMFMLVVKRGAQRLEQVDFPIDKGDKVRVTDGIFKGAEGYIRRVHGSRRFVVAIEGVVAVAVTHIPRQFLERIGGPADAEKSSYSNIL